jgi:hypothetical protein
MNNITITTELCQEDRNRLDTLIAIGLELVGKQLDVAPAETRQDAAETANTPAAETAHPADAVDVWSQPASEEPAVSGKLGDKGNEKLFSAVQQKVVKLSAAGQTKKAAVREIVQQYATKVSDIPAADYDTVMEKLTALEG